MQKCESCQTREAHVRLDALVNGRRESHFFCKQCAEQIMQGALAAEELGGSGANLGNIFAGRANGGGQSSANGS